MKKLVALFVVVGGLTWCSTVQASITNVVYSVDGDGALTCDTTWNTGSADTLTATGNQYSTPGDLLGTIYADTAADPTLIIRTILDNDTTFEWLSYSINISLNTNFVLSDAIAYSPSDWTSYITQPTYDNLSGLWIGNVSFNAGTPVPVGGTFDFGYTMVFSGSVQYNFAQELIPSVEPIPEPASWALIVLGMGALLVRGRNARCD